MKAIQKYNRDLDKWEYLFDYPMSEEEAKKEIATQRRWAKEDDTGAKFRIVNVELK